MMIDLFLILLAFIYLVIASIQDIRKREVWNWLNFSLLAFALVYRALVSLISGDSWFFILGLIGVGIFIVLGYLFYYARIFAGGDAKLLFGMGAVLSLSSSLYYNLIIYFAFVILLLFSGSLYGLIFSFFLALKDREKFAREFSKQLKKYRKYEYYAVAVACLLLFIPLVSGAMSLLMLPIVIVLLPLLYVYGKSIETCCMITELDTRELTEGDWLYSRVRVGKHVIKPYWEGLSIEELKILRKYDGKVKIKQGIPFIPAFLIAFIFLVWLVQSGLLF